MLKIKPLFRNLIFLYSSLMLLVVACDDDEPKDSKPPLVSFTNITPEMTVWNTVNITLDASDDRGINKVELFVGDNLITTLTQAPFELSWDSNTIADGTYLVKAVVTDKSGNIATEVIPVKVVNTLVTINIAADQLYNEGVFSERGIVFLSDENGNIITHQEYQNGNTIVFKSPSFNGEKFFLTEALISIQDDGTFLRMWTFAQIERGKSWVLLDDRADDDDETYAGEANITFTNLVANSSYIGSSNGEKAYASEFDNTSTIKLRQSPSKLYVVRDSELDELGPVAYNVYSNIVVGNNTVNLSQVTKPLTKVTANLPADALYASTEITAYAVANTYTNPYRIGYYSSGSNILSYDIYYPGNEFPIYYSEFNYETDDIYYSRGSNSQIFGIPTITNDVDLAFANNKLSYTATGDSDFITTSFENEAETAYWSLIFPEGTNQSIPVLKLPAALQSFNSPSIGFPDHYTVYDFEGFSDYDGLKNFIRNSTRSIDELYNEGKNYVDIIYKNPSPAGRSKRRHFHKAFGKLKTK